MNGWRMLIRANTGDKCHPSERCRSPLVAAAFRGTEMKGMRKEQSAQM